MLILTDICSSWTCALWWQFHIQYLCYDQGHGGFHSQPLTNGPTCFIVPNNTITHWWATFGEIVDLETLGITLVGVHISLPGEGLSSEVVEQLWTVRSPDIELSKSQLNDSPEHKGEPLPERTSMWILTTFAVLTRKLPPKDSTKPIIPGLALLATPLDVHKVRTFQSPRRRDLRYSETSRRSMDIRWADEGW